MTSLAIVQARMGSTRLPGKVLLPVEGATMLARVVERVRRTPELDEVMVATTAGALDQPIVDECARLGVRVFRGDEDDVLGRYHGAALAAGPPDVVVRVTADCPLFDPAVLSRMLRAFAALPGVPAGLDYLSNTMERTFPRGLDAEVLTWAALERAFRDARAPHQREHVTPYVYEHPEIFRLHAFTDERDLSELRWTVDVEEDYRFVVEVYRALYARTPAFGTDDVLALLRARPELATLNAHVQQKAVR